MAERKLALITGAARRVGAEVARHLHERGLDIIIHYRNSEADARALAETLNGRRADSVHLLAADLDDPEQVRSLAEKTLAVPGQLVLLVNNASTFYARSLLDTSDEDWLRLVHSNLRAPLILTQCLAPALSRAHGSIVNIVDVYAEKPLKDFPLYSVAKAGLAQLTRASARELGPDVRVNGVSPGPILWPEQGQDNQQAVLDGTALARSGSPTDIASAVAFLALDAPFVTGQILAVDGGRSLAFHGS
ncbi:MAG: pteridine reductase [Alcanivoracaceae bacterium]|nr:pteridine reductase [Alcanivoracaceae bacterium]